MTGIKVLNRRETSIDFEIYPSDGCLYRYEVETDKIRKVLGLPGTYGKALRGNTRKAVEAVARVAYENDLPFAIIA